MVDRVKTNLLVAFLAVMISLSVLSVSAFATPRFDAFQIGVNNTISRNNSVNITYNASQIIGFQINVSVVNATQLFSQGDPASIQNVTFMIQYQNVSNTTATYGYANFTQNYTFGSGGTIPANASTMSNTSTGIWILNISQARLGPAGNYNITIYAVNSSNIGNTSETFSFYIRPYPFNMTLKLNGTNGNRTDTTNLYNFDDNRVVVQFNGTVNVTGGVNATKEHINLIVDTNITGWIISAGSLANFTSDTIGPNTNTTAMDLLSNRTYSATLALTGDNRNFTASNVTLFFSVRDNKQPSITISSPTKGTFYTNEITLKFSASDNVAVDSCDYKVDSGSAKSATINKDIMVSDLANGDRVVKVICKDASTNEVTASVTVSISSAATSSIASVSTPVVSAPSEGKVQAFIAKISANKKATVQIEKSDVKTITITVKNDVTSVYININKLDAKPADATEAPGTVFRYLDIKPTALPDSSIKEASITFKVTKAWLTANKVDEDKVVLLRFSNSVWTQLNTTKISVAGDGEVTYEAKTPGFSYFAISTAGAQVPAPSEPTPTPAPSGPSAPTPTPTPTPAPSGGVDPLLIVVVVVIVIVVAVVLVRSGMI